MDTKELKGFLGIWTDMDKDFIPRFREWHSKEHMALRIATTGWYVGHRYHGLEGAPDFLICYETAEASDLGGKVYHQSLNEPDERTREALGHYRNSGCSKGPGKNLRPILRFTSPCVSMLDLRTQQSRSGSGRSTCRRSAKSRGFSGPAFMRSTRGSLKS